MAAVIERVRVAHLGLQPYESTLKAMREFTATRSEETPDELWLVQHPPVYTRGLAADARFGPKQDNGIPVVQVERGGEVTYHGPGQAIVYTLVDLARRGIKVRQFVAMLEQSVIDLLGRAESGAERAQRVAGAPGVYVNGAKVAALGIRVSKGCAFHGLALNVDMDLAPFAAIDPCGHPGLRVTQTRDLGFDFSADAAGERLARLLAARIDDA
ncbi:MAG TPA: lipoyl(octanoyl) transferase LipB [Burkholderiales bacterium]|nr:lipoyl(octanoyl) transferase LipB [Burkholderiales bacterium]